MTKSNHRESDYPIDPMFLDRWSPRAFTGEIIEEAQLLSLLDAAHWAPSSANHQPWRFIYTLKGSEQWEKFVALLVDSNQEWARNASALIFVMSRAFTGAAGSAEEKPSYTHSFDAGAAWGHLAIQARLSGLYAQAWAASSMKRSGRLLPFPRDTGSKQASPSAAWPTRAFFPNAIRRANSPASASRSPRSPSTVASWRIERSLRPSTYRANESPAILKIAGPFIFEISIRYRGLQRSAHCPG